MRKRTEEYIRSSAYAPWKNYHSAVQEEFGELSESELREVEREGGRRVREGGGRCVNSKATDRYYRELFIVFY